MSLIIIKQTDLNGVDAILRLRAIFWCIKPLMLVYPDENAMKQAIAEKIALIHIEEILAAINQFPARMDACLLAEGGHFNPNQQN